MKVALNTITPSLSLWIAHVLFFLYTCSRLLNQLSLLYIICYNYCHIFCCSADTTQHTLRNRSLYIVFIWCSLECYWRSSPILFIYFGRDVLSWDSVLGKMGSDYFIINYYLVYIFIVCFSSKLFLCFLF